MPVTESAPPAAESPQTHELSALARKHLEYVRDFYEEASEEALPAGENYVSILAHYYGLMIPAGASVLEVGCGSGALLSQLPNKDVTGIDLSAKHIAKAKDRVPHGTFHVMAGEELDLDRTYDYIILSDTLNQAADVQLIFERLQTVANRETRLCINFFSAMWRPILGLAKRLGLKAKEPVSNWLGCHDIQNMLMLAGWDVVVMQPRIMLPLRFAGLEHVINAGIAPLLGWFNLTMFTVARVTPKPFEKPKSVTVVVPARNEAGNIEAAIKRTPKMGAFTEMIFIEGNSTDNTWEEIQRVQKAYPEERITIMRQTGKGKGNAVREAYAVAQGDVLMILDADLTMPPEELPKFFDAIQSGAGEYVNGVRLVYPMEKEAMRFLNLVANKLFSVVFTYLLDQPIRDTLCGTKVMLKEHYEAIAANREYFGDFDPFGDFDLIFGAAKLNMKMVDIPIRYRDRTYGSTNIDRWRHGMLLFRMVGFAARKLKFI